MSEQDKEGMAFIKGSGGSTNGKMNGVHMDPQVNLSRQIRQLKRYMLGLAVLLALAFIILIITFSILFANLKWDIENHDHPPKIGAQMNKVLEKEELCLPCNEVRLGPSVEEDQMLDDFKRKPGESGRKDDEQCCVETPTQLLKILRMVSYNFLLVFVLLVLRILAIKNNIFMGNECMITQ